MFAIIPVFWTDQVSPVLVGLLGWPWYPIICGPWHRTSHLSIVFGKYNKLWQKISLSEKCKPDDYAFLTIGISGEQGTWLHTLYLMVMYML